MTHRFSRFLSQPELLGMEFGAPSWCPWRSIAAVGIDRTKPEDPALVERVTGRSVENILGHRIRQLYVIAGRGSGKSRAAAALGAYFCTAVKYARAAGEFIYVAILAPDRRQAAVTLRYVRGLLAILPGVDNTIVRESSEELELANGVILSVTTADHRSVRGRSIALAIIEEAAFLPTDESATPDLELLRALRPALARIPGSLLVVVSSPYARRGELYRAWREHYGKDSDTLVIQGDTLTLNPCFDREAITQAYAEDPIAAAAEFGAQFRSDVESFLSRDAVDSVAVPGRQQLPPRDGLMYRAFVDPSGGGADSFTLAIGHTEKNVAVLDCVVERRPPFNPDSVIEEFARLLKTYRINRVTGDAYAGEFPRARFAAHGITYDVSRRHRSDLYRDLLPAVNAGLVELLDHPRLLTQLASLERRTSRGGRDSIDHAPGGHDDVANSVAGVLTVTESVLVHVW